MERLVRVKRLLVSEIGFLFMPCEESAETKHEAFAGDSTKTRRNPSTQPKPETRQRLGKLLAHKPSIRLGKDSTENLAAGFPSDWISISSRTSSSSVEGIITQNFMSQENTLEAEKLTQTTDFLPSNGAACSPSSVTPEKLKLMDLIGCLCDAAWHHDKDDRTHYSARLLLFVEKVERDRDRYSETLHDGNAVYSALTDREKMFTTPENVSAVLDACKRSFSENVKGVARRRMDVQSEANEGCYPPLLPPSCSPRLSSWVRFLIGLLD
jgi:hypothetical protein